MLAVISRNSDMVKFLLFEANADPNLARPEVSKPWMFDSESVRHVIL